MPQPIRTIRTDRQAVPLQRDRSCPPSTRSQRERDWRTLVSTHRLLTRMTVEALKHHRADDADALAQQAALMEEELEHAYPFRWPRHRSEMIRQQAVWWAERHDDDVLACRSCQLQAGAAPSRIDLPPSRRDRD
jgi:hypothetical protein